MVGSTFTSAFLRLRGSLLLAAASVGLGLAVGLAAALVNPLILIGLAAGGLAAAWALRSPERALWLLMAVIALAPRVASPISIGFKPTLVDAALALMLAAWGLRAGRYPIPWRELPISLPLLALMAVAVATFIFGLPNGPFTTLVARRFAEMLLSLASVFVVAAILRDAGAQRRAAVAVVVFGAASAAAGIALYAMPDELAIRLLSALRPFDYPFGPEVLRYIRDDPALLQRATGTWIDPNAYGGFLLVAGAFALPQVFAARPSLPRWLAAACAAVIALALVLTASRGALLGLLAVALLVGGTRYRLVLAAAAAGVVLILILPQTRDLAAHFADGFMVRDLATQMRLGEYKDALRLIERYPWLGVGFADTPDVDLYIGVSMMYLLIAQQMGMLGLLAFLSVIGGLGVAAIRALRRMAGEDGATPVWVGAHAAVAGILASGVFDHYFLNIDFHNAVMLFCLVIGVAAASSRAALVRQPG